MFTLRSCNSYDFYVYALDNNSTINHSDIVPGEEEHDQNQNLIKFSLLLPMQHVVLLS
ncbi:hypothetical protein [Guptibacillus sedimenti]|uniref:hypothetical protein n=1 Tax=Guptibacillus sedimenti TaxID=3025680 RepID=UPI003B59F334